MEPPVSLWLWLHIPLISISYVLFLAASLSGLAFIVQERLLKTRPALAMIWRVPPLDVLERFIYRMIGWAFPLLSLSILLGMVWAKQSRGRFWGWDPSETFTLITWAIYAVYLALRGVSGWRGRKSTYLALVGFGLVLVSLAILVSFSPLHQTGGMP